MDNFLQELSEPKSNLNEIDLIKNIYEMVNRVNEGYENELKAYIFFSDAEKAFKDAKEKILNAAIIERQKYDEKTLEIFGKKISFIQSGRYDYSTNQEYVNLKNQMSEIEEKMKAAYNYSIKGVAYIDTDTGEIIPIPIYTPSKLSLKIG